MTLLQTTGPRRWGFIAASLCSLAAAGALAQPADATFPGLPGKIAFAGIQAFGLERDIFVVDADGSNRKRLTSAPGGDFDPAFSSSGRRIAFVSERDQPRSGLTPRNHREIYVMNADGSGETRLTRTNPDPANANLHGSPTFSPSGRRIAFDYFAGPDAGADIYVMNADGTGRVNLTPENNATDDESDAQPAFSPDGRRIAFVSDRADSVTRGAQAGRRGEIFVMNADGSGVRQVTRVPDLSRRHEEPSNPNFSPDGQWITYSLGKTEIRRIRVDGSRETLVTRAGFEPVFSPDGDRIAFGSSSRNSFGDPGAAGEGGIHVTRLDGSGRRRLTSGPAGLDEAPDWGPGLCGGRTPTVSATLSRARASQDIPSPQPDVIVGTPGPDVIVGTDGPDRIRGGGGRDIICAGGGRDRVLGGGGRDRINGGTGGDRLYGGSGGDRIRGAEGDDRLRGQDGNDRLFGEDGNDRLSGGKGRDRIRGGKGRDRMNGGSGRDACVGGPNRDVSRSCNLT